MTMLLKRLRAILLPCLLTVAFGASAATDMFLKLEGIEGESVDEKHRGQMDLLAWSWGLSNSVTLGGSGAGRVFVNDLAVTKYVDKATPTLILKTCDGTHVPAAVLAMRRAGTQLDYLKIEMEDVLVSGVATGGAAGQDRPTENVTLKFARFRVTYTPVSATGAPGTPITNGWDLIRNVRY